MNSVLPKSNLSVTGLTTTGALATAGIAGFGGVSNTYDQWLAAPTGFDLTAYDWSFKGDLTLAMNGTRANNELLKFEITDKSGNFTQPVPEPTTMGLLGMSAFSAFRKRFRKYASLRLLG